jgi:hypothetical protein
MASKAHLLCPSSSLLSLLTYSQVLNWVIFLWWLAIPLLSIVIQQAAVKQAQAAAEEEEERRKNPFASMFRDMRSSMGGMGGSPSSGGFSAKSSSKSSKRDSGPIIEAEWKPLDK